MLRSIGLVAFLALLMVGCGGGSSGPPPAYTVNGVTSGLVGTGLVLRDNGGDDLAVTANGVSTFSTRIVSGGAYSVTVLTQPSNPGQTCTLKYGSGTMGSSEAIFEVICVLNLAGPYRFTDISGTDARSGPVAYDGAGGYSGSYESNASGVISNGAISGVYTSALGGAVTVGARTGGVSADGNTIVSADLRAGKAPTVDVEIRQGQKNFANADFYGTYRIVSVTSLGDASSNLALVSDGAGRYSGNLLSVSNIAGTTTTAVTGSYSVASDGALTLTPDSGSALSGGISADGKTLVLSQLTAGQPSAFAVGIKQGQANFTNGDVKGTYNFVRYTSNDAQLQTLVFDGAGVFTGTALDNANGSASSSSVSGTYAVAADGSITLTVPMPHVCRSRCGPAPVFTGGVSSDGNTLVLTGTFPTAGVGVRLPR